MKGSTDPCLFTRQLMQAVSGYRKPSVIDRETRRKQKRKLSIFVDKEARVLQCLSATS